MPDTRHAHFGVTHRRRAIAIDRSKVTLPVDQHVTQREILRHAHDGVVHRDITVRMVLTDHVANDTRRFLVGLVPVVGQLVHGKQHTTMHRLQAVTRIRQCPPDDHAHRVIEIRTTHLVFQADRNSFFSELLYGLFHFLSG